MQTKPPGSRPGWTKIADAYQILAMDARAFREWAKLMDGQPDQLMEDAMIAATARIHRLIVVSRNTKDFERLGIQAVNFYQTTFYQTTLIFIAQPPCSSTSFLKPKFSGRRFVAVRGLDQNR